MTLLIIKALAFAALVTSSLLVAPRTPVLTEPVQKDTIEVRRFPGVFVTNENGLPQPLAIRNLDVDVEITGTLARTTIDMTVYNPHNRVLEGEFSFPLNDGQTVARFAGRFPNQVAVIHSELSTGERYDTWRRIRDGEVLGMEDEGSRLRSPEPAVEADQLLEGTALLQVGVVEATDHHVGHVLEAVGPPQVLGGGRRERRERIPTLDPALVEVVDA